MEKGNSEGTYTLERMQQMATIAQSANGLEISGNSFKMTALTGSPDMLLFACERFEEIQAKAENLINACALHGVGDMEEVDELVDALKTLDNKLS